VNGRASIKEIVDKYYTKRGIDLSSILRKHPELTKEVEKEIVKRIKNGEVKLKKVKEVEIKIDRPVWELMKDGSYRFMIDGETWEEFENLGKGRGRKKTY
jgi:hypothetical protein